MQTKENKIKTKLNTLHQHEHGLNEFKHAQDKYRSILRKKVKKEAKTSKK